jgi:hypothetical protein
MDSDQAEVTGTTLTVPAALTRLMKSVRVAFETWLAVTPAGSCERSNWRKVVLPLPTARLASVPRLVVGRVELTLASPVRVT